MKVKPHVDRSVFPDGHSMLMLVLRPTLNLSCAAGHPSLVYTIKPHVDRFVFPDGHHVMMRVSDRTMRCAVADFVERVFSSHEDVDHDAL